MRKNKIRCREFFPSCQHPGLHREDGEGHLAIPAKHCSDCIHKPNKFSASPNSSLGTKPIKIKDSKNDVFVIALSANLYA
jgi:hypothetical protein